MVYVRYLPTGTVHLVEASGGPEDGSLYTFLTYCRRTIRQIAAWQEIPDRPEQVCGNCRRVEAANANL